MFADEKPCRFISARFLDVRICKCGCFAVGEPRLIIKSLHFFNKINIDNQKYAGYNNSCTLSTVSKMLLFYIVRQRISTGGDLNENRSDTRAAACDNAAMALLVFKAVQAAVG